MNDEEEDLIVKDCHGNILQTGDAVMLTQDLKVKGSTNLKRGEVIKNIRLTDDNADVVECKKGKTVLVLKTCYLTY